MTSGGTLSSRSIARSAPRAITRTLPIARAICVAAVE
jgi:hypothetical protein